MGTRAPVLVQDAETEIPSGVLERLQHRYLLRLEPRFGADWLELAHDRLVGPITRSNARHIAASNHKRVGLGLAALFLFAGGWGWHDIQIERAAKARDQLVADMKKEIAAEPDLGMLIQACAHSRSLEGSPASGPSCPADDRLLSEQIVNKQGAEEFATRQQELHAYVRSPFGAIVNLARQGDSYRATLDNGKYFVAGFETPTIPSEADLKASTPSNPGSLDIAPATDIAATDASQEYVIASRCSESCVTQVRMLNNRSDDWAPVVLDQPAATANTIVRGIAASGSTLVYAVCGQGSGLECPAQVEVYRLSDNRLSAQFKGTLPGTFNIISMAASETGVAIAYQSIGGSIKVKVYPVPLPTPATRWLPDGSRIFDVPFKTLSSLLFDKEGKILVASAEDLPKEGYLIDWNLDEKIFDNQGLNYQKLESPAFAQLMRVSASGNIVVTALGMMQGPNAVEHRDPVPSCIKIEEIEGGALREIANDTTCANSTAPGDRMQGWNTVAMDGSGSTIAVANQFSNKGMVIERTGASY